MRKVLLPALVIITTSLLLIRLFYLQVIDTLGVGGAEKIFVTICNLLVNSEVSVTGLFLTEAGVLKNQLNKIRIQISLKAMQVPLTEHHL